MIDHGRDGFLHPPDDLDGMARSAVSLLTDSHLHAQVVAAALSKVRETFCEEKIVPLYEAYYEEILAGWPGRVNRRDGRIPSPAQPAQPAQPA